MIITKTPFRISFFGGGTDYPEWFTKYSGAVLSTTINKYCYISCRRLPPFFEHKHRIVYSKIENTNSNDGIEHPSVREIFKWKKIMDGMEIHHDGDLPARSGLGSSSSFTVGLLNALNAIKGETYSKNDLAKDAIYVEQKLIGENVGSQDQVSAAYGGLNRINFCNDSSFIVEPVIISAERKRELHSHLMLFFTGLSRFASQIAGSKIKNFDQRQKELHKIYSMVDEGISIIQSKNTPIKDFGKLLDEGWRNKRALSDQVSNFEIDQIYETAINTGAVGGKILGAGGGGFLLLFAKPENHSAIREKLNKLIFVPFEFENSGSRVVLYEPNGF